ncbi:hypothetical protein SCLCIDRAFT_455010 [Scleroderma citrinum Foug A]|uniref:Uncharacterized protein n=1 Tax=Scleroderma citrinum Foug A TaxID=1036808 RepID=A0A0C3DA53_9AGAM|nr:hypothetical protein SCLCIDRAFT_455010 [Scleroderma citrinum Foug A]
MSKGITTHCLIRPDWESEITVSEDIACRMQILVARRRLTTASTRNDAIMRGSVDIEIRGGVQWMAACSCSSNTLHLVCAWHHGPNRKWTPQPPPDLQYYIVPRFGACNEL